MENEDNDKPHLTEQERQVLIHNAIRQQERDKAKNRNKPRPDGTRSGFAQGVDFDLF
jgi:hypothetical protein